jgi:dTDP-4-dehydrorhamnose reductase
MKKLLSLIIFSFFWSTNAQKFLIFGGKTGWIGQKFVILLHKMGHEPLCAQSRLEDREALINEIIQTQPHFIINTAGITGKPNVDWCETHKEETLRTNVLGTLNLIDVAFIHKIPVTNISTGCIYEYDEKHPLGSGIGFTEEEEPNFHGSFYSRNKIILEKLILEYPHVLNLRVKMPISTELDKGFVGKITKYKKVVNIPNSLSILDDLLPLVIDMTLQGIKGNYNFVNPGTLSHNEVLDLYKEYIDPTFTYENFSLEEQAAILKVPRANAELSAAKLLKLYPELPPVKDALIKIFKIIKETL